MPAYLIAQVKIHDPEIYKQYMQRTPALIAKYGGRFIVRGGTSETLEGAVSNRLIVIVEFPSMDRAREFYNSPEYRQAKAIRTPVSDAEFVLVEGAA